MAELLEGLKYGLTSLPNGGPVDLLHVKLTDSALRAIDEFNKIKKVTSRRPSIQFTGNKGIIHVPIKKSSDNPEGFRSYAFSLSTIQTDPKGSFDCIKQISSSYGSSLQAQGCLTHKLTINATDDVYQSTKDRMAAVEEESKKQCAKEIKVGGKNIGRRVKKVVRRSELDLSSTGRRPSPSQSMLASSTPAMSSAGHLHHQRSNTAPAAAPSSQLTHRTASPLPKPHSSLDSPATVTSGGATGMAHGHRPHLHNTAAAGRTSPNPTIINLPYRDRVIHLLAIRSYKKPELMARLQRDGVREKDKHSLSTTLKQVAIWNGKENSYNLARHLISDVRSNWPGYTDHDRQLLKRMMESSPAHCPPVVPSPTHSTSSHGSPTSSQKRPTSTTGDNDHIMPYKKQRIAHGSRPRPPNNTTSSATTNASNTHPSMTHHHIGVLTDKREASPKVTSRTPHMLDSILNVQPVKQEVTTTTPDISTPTHTPMELDTKDTRLKVIDLNGNRSNITTKEAASSTSETPDYIMKYTSIETREQRQLYKIDFNMEYNEYKMKHGSIEKVTKRFKVLEGKLKSKPEGSKDFESVKKMIFREYRTVKQDPKYVEHRKRCDYLHQKLGHIKRLVLEFDQNHIMAS